MSCGKERGNVAAVGDTDDYRRGIAFTDQDYARVDGRVQPCPLEPRPAEARQVGSKDETVEEPLFLRSPECVVQPEWME